jgi:hypothetical protein
MRFGRIISLFIRIDRTVYGGNFVNIEAVPGWLS